ncbi:PAS domain S-box protein [Mariprofundus erugo]|uniref:methyl-accepting chemotaxis protein n=1 Tax=Mariprofundus erugo TaxID=2528639 RepID=UPI0010FE5BFF|nr:PAS domain-containing methyl-accepting chemotaxis protein [Mariprofundus erugo]TLS78217.1 PAS domain S-box protein [Mariprofundus erugo]
MRKNLPVTNHEVVMRDDQVIISSTNLKGIITEVDQDFLDISGFSRDELIGKNHNIIRHPDMPPSAFQWLWDTIRAGKPWTGIVKNRCKNGDYYWVQANVTPIIENGDVTGYVSVRTKPKQSDIDVASRLYAEINAGKVVLGQQSILQKLNPFSRMRISHKISGTLVLMAVMLTGSWLLTLQGLTTSQASLQMAGNDRAVSIAASSIQNAVLSVIVDLKKTHEKVTAESLQHSHRYLNDQLAALNKNITLIEGADLSDEESASAAPYLKSVRDYINNTLKPIDEAMLKNDTASFNASATALINDGYQSMRKLAEAFHQVQLAASSEEAAEGTAAYEQIRSESLIAVSISLLLAAMLSLLLIRNFSRRLRYTLSKLNSIAEGNYFDWVTLDSNDEIGVLQEGLKSMQIRQGYQMRRIREQATDALRIKHALDQVASPVQIADAAYNIFYTNEAANEMFHAHQQDIRNLIRNFDPAKVQGANIDMFHRDPAHQRRLLDHLQGRYVSEDLTFSDNFIVTVGATPVTDENGNRLATIVEWTNRTTEVKVEQEIATIFSAVQRGDLSQRATVADKSGFFRQLSEMVNELSSMLQQSFNDVGQAVQALSEGNLTHRITHEYEGAFNDIKQAANDTAERLAEVIGEVRASAEEVGLGSGEIAEANNTLNTRTQEQAAALEETAASIEEITGTVQQTADNSRQANQLASDARVRAEKGGQVAQRAVEAMADINASSRKISDIIGVIDEIAFQTNLLALNAAVEAARAGEQGRGFAVVAGEVRSLAQRSAEAAKEIKVLINQSVKSVEGGSKLVDESGTALTEIVIAVSKVGDIIAEIAAASVEQTSGIDQINKAIAQLDSGTQQNTAMVEESAAASQRLNEQATNLRQQVSIFTLRD